MKNFKKGDTVYSDDYGNGYVVGIDDSLVHPVEVQFMDQDIDDEPLTYTMDGREDETYEISLRHADHDFNGY